MKDIYYRNKDFPWNLISSILNRPTDPSTLNRSNEPTTVPDDLYPSIMYIIYQLDDDQRRVIIQRFIEKKRVSGIAKDMDISPERVKTLTDKAIRLMSHPRNIRLIKFGVKFFCGYE